MFSEKNLIEKAKKLNKTIVFPEAGFSDRIIEAVKIITKQKIAKVVLIADESALVLQYKKLNNVTIINPKTSSLRDEFAKKIFEKRQHKGVTEEKAQELAVDPFYFATMLVNEGYADGMVGGAEVSTGRNLKPGLELVKAKPEEKLVSTAMLMYGKNKVTGNQPFILADCGLNENPSAEQLAIIAKQCTKLNEELVGLMPRVAFLSYSTKGSAKSESVTKVADAFNQFKTIEPYTFSEGEVQFDSAMIPRVAKIKIPTSKLTEQNANILVFPDLNSANICYKAISYFGNLKAIGPIAMGFNRPINDLSRGATLDDIVVLTAVTVLQCE